MSWLGDLWDWNRFAIKDIAKGIGNDPERALFGSFDPLSTKMWNKVLGRDDEPIISQLGGATEESFQRGEAKGIDTRAGRQMQDVADTVAMYYGTAGAGEALGGLMPSGGEGAAGNVDWGKAATNLMRQISNGGLSGGGGYSTGGAGQASFNPSWDAAGNRSQELSEEAERQAREEERSRAQPSSREGGTYAEQVAQASEEEQRKASREQSAIRARQRVRQDGIADTTRKRWNMDEKKGAWSNLRTYYTA